MLFLGLGTGLGSTLIVDGIVEPMELGHLPYRKGTYEDYVGLRGLEKHGQEEMAAPRRRRGRPPDRRARARRRGARAEATSSKLKELPPGCRAGDNANAFLGGFRLWEDARPATPSSVRRSHSARTDTERSSR